jgi:hypothetical protein
MDQSSSPNYKELFERETQLRRQAEEERRQAEERNRQFTRKTSPLEYLQTRHNLLSRPLRVRTRLVPKVVTWINIDLAKFADELKDIK